MTDPISEPLTYPGRPPTGPGVLHGDSYLADPAGELAASLAASGAPPPAERHALLAVGSNASPDQLRRKFREHGVPTVLPMAPATVDGVAAGVSAHVGRAGYVPAAPIAVPGETAALWVIWPDEAQLEALDATEPNYDRVPLGRPVVLRSGEPLDDCSVYASRWGCLADDRGRLRRLTGQRELLASLLAESPALRSRFGDTPESFVARAADKDLREWARRLFKAEGRVRPTIWHVGHAG